MKEATVMTDQTIGKLAAMERAWKALGQDIKAEGGGLVAWFGTMGANIAQGYGAGLEKMKLAWKEFVGEITEGEAANQFQNYLERIEAVRNPKKPSQKPHTPEESEQDKNARSQIISIEKQIADEKERAARLEESLLERGLKLTLAIKEASKEIQAYSDSDKPTTEEERLRIKKLELQISKDEVESDEIKTKLAKQRAEETSKQAELQERIARLTASHDLSGEGYTKRVAELQKQIQDLTLQAAASAKAGKGDEALKKELEMLGREETLQDLLKENDRRRVELHLGGHQTRGMPGVGMLVVPKTDEALLQAQKETAVNTKIIADAISRIGRTTPHAGGHGPLVYQE
jgi:hypothetical protein